MYDVVIIGAGVAGAALAARLGRLGKRVALIERDWRPPRLFVGELLQPGGVAALEAMELTACLEGIDAQPTVGFAVTCDGATQSLTYPATRDGATRDGATRDGATGDGETRGYAFHHGRFVDGLRRLARACDRVDAIEGTATGIVEGDGQVTGVTYRDHQGQSHGIDASLVVAADGRNSRLRKDLGREQPHRVSYSVGVLLQGAELPSPGCGNVVVTDPTPLLCYRVATDDIRVLVDVPGKLPAKRDGHLTRYLNDKVAPQLPDSLRGPFLESILAETPRIMSNYALAPRPRVVPGTVMLGDALNMRHPVTGSGMTVALNDARLLAELIEQSDTLVGKPGVKIVRRFYSGRHALAATLDILAGALYRVFSGADPGLVRMRDAMFRYWNFGGVAEQGPMALISGLDRRPTLLLLHYLAVTSLGAGISLAPSGEPRRLLPDVRGASQVLRAAYRTMQPQVRRAFTR